MSNLNAIEIKGLTKSYNGFTLENLDLTLPGGCILGLIGENGAGKSTTIKLILDMIKRDGGSVKILGRDNSAEIKMIKEDVGTVFDEVGIPECLNAVQVGKIMRGTFKRWNPVFYKGLLERLSVPIDKPFGKLSRGNKMKLGLAVAMSHNAKLLLLDEATSGLDPVVRDDVLDILNEFTRNEEHSVLMSSHIVSDLEKICDYIAFLHKGKLILFEEKDALLAEYGVIHCTAERLAELDPAAIKHKKITPYGAEAIVKRSAVPSGTEISPVSIEELFVQTTKGEVL
ncbi:MAG: ABC transporter ATP-binding protein [Oscillospiraceae bacterium]|nr:ABC transporter ATP-binding protein [Oscillospiraceae bacterium]